MVKTNKEFTMMTEYLLLKYDHKETDSVEQKMKEHLNFYMLFLNSEIDENETSTK